MNNFLCKLIKGRICQKKLPFVISGHGDFFGFFLQNSHFFSRAGSWKIIIIIIIMKECKGE